MREIHAHIRFKGGAMRSVKLDTPVIIYEKWKTKPHVIKEGVDRETALTISEESLWLPGVTSRGDR